MNLAGDPSTTSPPQSAASPAGSAPATRPRMVLASNRGPVEFTLTDSGRLEARRGSGGVVSALISAAHEAPVAWVACPMGPGDRLALQRAAGGPIPAPDGGEPLDVRFVNVSQEAYDRYYNVFANPLLWFLQHYLWDIAAAPNINAAVYDAWEHGYTVVNRAMAEAVAAAAGAGESRPVVLFQDYHLYLAPGYTRELLPKALLQHFVHIPWPAPRYWSLLPEAFRGPILRSLLQNDIVGFQTHRDAHNFLYTCEYLLPEARVSYRSSTVRWRNRTCYVRAYPISIDVPGVLATVQGEAAQQCRARLQPLRGTRTIVRVDRLEPSKNIVRGFKAFDTLLNRYPELAGQVKFWAFLVPSRTGLSTYQQYHDEVFALVDQINTRHGNDAWKPIEVFYENNYVQALAGMAQYDVLLVNSVIDGMNLVAKEGVTVNEQDGVLILSETAGAWEQLGADALPVAATDVEGTVRALHAALTMGQRERHRRAKRLRASVAAAGLDRWIRDQTDDLDTLLETGRLKPQPQRDRRGAPPAR